MDNETPRYATWIPEAGGYVANGNVVSKSPMYDEAGKLKLDVDTSVFGNTQPLKTQPQVANQAQTNVGVTTANIQGSGTDANAAVTNIGNMASLADNKQNGLDSVLSSPAMRSPSAGEPILTVEQQDLKEIQDAKARNDLQGMINGYTKLGRDTGVDYSATISDLTKQRQQKIQTTDDQYLQSINDLWNQVSTAKSQGDITGDYTKYNQALAEYTQLLSDQEKWRNDVGYAQSMADMYRAEEEAIELDYVPTYLQGISDISNQIIQMYPAILNFEYNPNTDTSLYMAQGYAQSRVKETMNATGMYYSTMTQSAIAKAVAELVPVYEKMAREEMIENFKLLQTTANFLLDLEQTQFNLWKSQIELKWEANQEKRKQIAQAIENANARGYFTNEEAALLGVAPGTESPDARNRAQAKQDQIEAEERTLIQEKALAKYKEGLEEDKLREQERLQEKYYQYQLDHTATNIGSVNNHLTVAQNADGSIEYTIPANRTEWGTYDTDKLISYYNDLIKSGEKQTSALDKLWVAAKSQEAFDQAIAKINSGDTAIKENKKSLSEMQSSLKDMVGTYKPSEILNEAIKLANENGVEVKNLLNAITYPKSDDSNLSGNMFDPRSLAGMGQTAYGTYVDFYKDNDGSAEDMLDNIGDLIATFDLGYKNKSIAADEYDYAIGVINRDLISNQYLDKKLTKAILGSNEASKTSEAIKNAKKKIDSYASSLYESQAPLREEEIADAYNRLLGKVANAGDEFDYNVLPGNTGIKSRTEAAEDIITSVRDNKTYGKNIAPAIFYTIVDYKDILEGQGKIGQIKV